MNRSIVHAAMAGFALLAALAGPALAQESQGHSDISAGTATAYCLAKHTGVTAGTDGYSAEGFEVASSAIVGSVRRNFVSKRNKPANAGEFNTSALQTCPQACAQAAIPTYAPSLVGVELKYRPEGSAPMPSGIGDHEALALYDWELREDWERVVSGFWAWPQGALGDGGEHDSCCCQVVNAPTEAK